jgi:putative ABC transport system substrate-binding protein
MIVVVPRARAQPAKARRIAVFWPGNASGFQDYLAEFKGALKKLGYVEGRDVDFAVRYGELQTGKFGSLAKEVVASKPDLILTASSGAVVAFKAATSSIPIVFASAGSPVEQGLVASLQRPGGNITGLTTQADLYGKVADIIREALPGARQLAVLVHDGDPFHERIVKAVQPSAQRLQLESHVINVPDAASFERIFNEISRRKVDVVFVPLLAFFNAHRREIADRSVKARVPLVALDLAYAREGALLVYGFQQIESYRRAAALVDKILKGAKPGELAIEQPDRFQLIVNRKTAKLIGAELSTTIMLRADRVID